MHEFSRKSSFSKLRTTQKQTIHLSFASWMLGCLRKEEVTRLTKMPPNRPDIIIKKNVNARKNEQMNE